MKRIILTMALLSFSAGATTPLIAQSSKPKTSAPTLVLAQAQNAPIKPVKPGELHLTISNEDGVLPISWRYELYRIRGGKDKDTTSERVYFGEYISTEGGLLRWQTLVPGEYELFMRSNEFVSNLQDHAPVRIQGMVIQPAKAVRLSVILHKGKMLETIGKPTIDTPPAIIVSEEIESLKREIAELKKQIEELKKK